MTATPPRADLRTLAAEAARRVFLSRADAQIEAGPSDHARAIADAVLADVLPEHRRMVRRETLQTLLDRADSFSLTMDGQTAAQWLPRLIGDDDKAAEVLDLLAAAAPPASSSATVAAEDAPAVPEEAAPDLREMAGRWFKLADDADWLTTWLTAHGLSATAGPGQVVRAVARDLQAWAVTGQPAQGDALTYAEMESERDRLAWELYQESLLLADMIADRDRLAAQVDQIRALHAPKPCPKGCDHCAHCGTKYAWPCPTAAAVDALPDAGTDQTEDDHG